MRFSLPAHDADGFDAPEIGGPGDEQAIARYLEGERRAAARRILQVGVAALALGGIGLVPLADWWSHGGVVPRVVLAAPLLLCVGILLTAYGAIARARA